MIIITGGAGFIGSAFAWYCNTHHLEDILIVDNLHTSSKWKNLANIKFSDYLHKDNFLDMVLHDNLPKNIEAIIHMGACSATNQKDVDYLMANNYTYTKLLAQWAIKNKVRFIYASSAATYGNGELGFSDVEKNIPSLLPTNAYGYSKQLFDLYALKNNLLSQIVGLKFFNVYGPNEYHKGPMRSLICKAYQQVLDTKCLNLFKSYKSDFANGGQLRDFVYIKDCLKIIWWLLQNPQVNGIFNLGTGQAHCWNEVANAIFKSLKMKPHINYIEMPSDIRAHYQYFTQADMRKLNKLKCPLNFTSLEDAIHDYIQHYLVQDKHLSIL
jgi:ADP-L-glycero-D-manno-heptose 6-epimerase